MLPYRSNDICIIKSIETNRSKRRLAYKLFRYPISRQRNVKILFLVLIVCARRNCENSKKRERKGKRNLVFLFEKSYFSPLYHESTYSNNRSIDLFSHFVQPPPYTKAFLFLLSSHEIIGPGCPWEQIDTTGTHRSLTQFASPWYNPIIV